jgi:hypothetical protein
LKKTWFDEHGLTNKAFRRRPRDEDGISVAASREAAKKLQDSGFGTASLLIARIILIPKLSVKCGDDDHGYIDGVPVDAPENPLEIYNKVMWIADQLVEIAKDDIVVDPWK